FYLDFLLCVSSIASHSSSLVISILLLFFLLLLRPPPPSTLFPYTTLFRSSSRYSYATWSSNNRPNTRNWTCSYNIRFTLWYTFSNSLSYNRCNWCTCFRTVYRRSWYSAWTDRWFFNRIHSYYSFHGILLRNNKFYIKKCTYR